MRIFPATAIIYTMTKEINGTCKNTMFELNCQNKTGSVAKVKGKNGLADRFIGHLSSLVG